MDAARSRRQTAAPADARAAVARELPGTCGTRTARRALRARIARAPRRARSARRARRARPAGDRGDRQRSCKGPPSRDRGRL